MQHLASWWPVVILVKKNHEKDEAIYTVSCFIFVFADMSKRNWKYNVVVFLLLFWELYLPVNSETVTMAKQTWREGVSPTVK